MRKTTTFIALGTLLLIVLLLSGCVQLLYSKPGASDKEEAKDTLPSKPELAFGKVTSFREGFTEIKKIDAQYNANFRKESLGKFVVALEDIVPMEQDLLKLLRHVNGTPDVDIEALAHKRNKTEIDLVALFIGARLEMLESERYFNLGYKDGNAGLVGDGFFCSERPLIMESVEAFNASIRHGLNATYYLDVVLSISDAWTNITRDLIGVDESKPTFYTTKFQDLSAQLRKNVKLVTTSCMNQTKKDVYVVIDQPDKRKA